MFMEKASMVKTEFKCRCKRRLVFMEQNNIILFGCPRCDCYLVILPWQVRDFKRNGFFDWRGFMKYVYSTYLDARDSVCQ
jgi:hypothetical protein